METSGINLGSPERAFVSLSMCFTLGTVNIYFYRPIVLLFEGLLLKASSTFSLTEVKDEDGVAISAFCY